MKKTPKALWTSVGLIGLALFVAAPASADQVFLDDVIVDGSLCAGFDCVNGENFGFDTIRLKENNVRIKFDDTSTTASFPQRDWQLTANDTSNGGQEKFSIDDITGGRTPFTIEAGAPNHSLYVEDGGRVGLGTSTPVVQLHVKDGNTPTLRLEQDGSDGFTAQTWDVAGNEANFFIRDATNGSTLPLRIFPGAPSNSLTIEASTGDIGIGTTSPASSLHVQEVGAQLRVEDTDGASAQRTVLQLRNRGRGRMLMIDTETDARWFNGFGVGDTFVMDSNGGSGTNFGNQEFVLEPDGDVIIQGMLTELSDRNAKRDFVPVDPRQVLERVVKMPITSWSYKHDPPDVRHLGPVAQEFHAAFGLGATDKGISSADSAGVALTAIQGLHSELAERDATIQSLEDRLAALEALLGEESR